MRGQAHTVEAFGAAVILVVSLLFAMQVTAVTPLSASTSSQHIENQQQAVAEDVLRAADGDGELESAVLYWNASEKAFHGLESEEDTHYSPNEFADRTAVGERLNETFTDRGIAYNLHVNHVDNESRAQQRIVYSGEPSDHAVGATRLLTLYEGDSLYDASETETDTRLNESETFYVGNTANESFYGVVEVEVIVWRM